MAKTIQEGQFGPIYLKYKNKPRAAIIHLKRVKKGECLEALYRDDIGYVDIVWGENDPQTNKGYGLKHIIEKHGKDIKKLGFEVEDFIPIVFQYGDLSLSKNGSRFYLTNNLFKIVIQTTYFNKQKKWLLTAFDIKKVALKGNFKRKL